MLRIVSIGGCALERRPQYRAAAKEEIDRELSLYREAFRHAGGMSWKVAQSRALEYEKAIRNSGEELLKSHVGFPASICRQT
jgi:hypothetical protein